MTKQELETLYAEIKSVRKIAKLLNLSYFKCISIFEAYKIKSRPKGNPFGVPHRTKKYINLK